MTFCVLNVSFWQHFKNLRRDFNLERKSGLFRQILKEFAAN